jgi:hypothetical protein
LIEKDFNINIINFEENYWSNKKKTTNSWNQIRFHL